MGTYTFTIDIAARREQVFDQRGEPGSDLRFPDELETFKRICEREAVTNR